MAINIVLIEPEIPSNTGNIIRTCACTGSRLHLIRPLGFSMEEKKLRRAGLDYLDLVEICYYDSFEELEEKYPNAEFFMYSTKSNRNHTDVRYEDECISDSILDRYADCMVRIPMLNEERMRCLNLSNSVAIGVYEAIRQLGYHDFR